MASRAHAVKILAGRYHAALRTGTFVEDVVSALADACKRAIVDATPPSDPKREKLIAFYARCAEILDSAAAQIREARS